MDITMIGTIASILLGGGILTFIQFLISRHDKKHDRMDEVLGAIGKIQKDVEQVKRDADQRDAVLARTHILRFADELYNNIKHSKEYFDQTLDDIKTYETFCEHNEDFANGRTEVAVKYIKSEYERLIREHKL